MGRRVREMGIRPGRLNPGRYNAITDVPGVEVGHVTLIWGEGRLVPGEGPVRTGVTAVRPHPGNLYREKVIAACHIINGYGKTVGLSQIAELGVLETPIILTNTLNVGRAADALIDYMLRDNPGIGISSGTVNPVVCECNDAFLNDIQGRHVKREDVLQALENCRPGPVAEGGVGAGTGMSCFNFKGGIGSSSRLLETAQGEYCLGALVLSNFGELADLIISGMPVGRRLEEYFKKLKAGSEGEGLEPGPADDGSIITILATNLPLNSRQLGRLARRVPAGLGRTGSHISGGSGDYVLAFSTANRLVFQPDEPAPLFLNRVICSENHYLFNRALLAVVEVVEEAVLNSLFSAEGISGRDGHRREALPVEEVIGLLRDKGQHLNN